ncbi:VanZ family protein [Cryobacterium sp. TMT1-21]|nr:VanZ family protein [Cryobacterium sp. TMT1-21]
MRCGRRLGAVRSEVGCGAVGGCAGPDWERGRADWHARTDPSRVVNPTVLRSSTRHGRRGPTAQTPRGDDVAGLNPDSPAAPLPGSPTSGTPAADSQGRARLRRWALRLGLAYLVALLLIAFWPTPVDRDAHDFLLATLGWLQGHGAPGWVRYDLVEFMANVVLFVPVGMIVVILAGSRRWWLAVLAGFAASCTIELGQLIFLPARFATLSDVVANTAGAAVGAVLALMLLPLLQALALAGSARRSTRGPTGV